MTRSQQLHDHPINDGHTLPRAAAAITIVGNPKAGSRTLSAATALTDALIERWSGSGDNAAAKNKVIDLADIAGGLLAPWSLSDEAANAVSQARSADLLIVASPTYKASFTGLLKLLLDALPAGSLSDTVVVQLVISGAPTHGHLADVHLRPVLAELGAVMPAPSLLLLESELNNQNHLLKSYVDRYASTIVAALRK
jgi:FMN reductase